MLRKYVGTFRAAEKEGEVKEVRTEMRRQMLYVVRGIVIKKALEVEEEEEVQEDKAGVKSKKAARGPTKGKGKGKGVQTGRITKTTAPKKAAPKPQAKAAANSLTAAMAHSPVLRHTTSTSTTTTSTTPIASPAPKIITTPLYLNINGVPKFKIGGVTKEEADMNKELQVVGRLGPGGEIVSFDVRMGEIEGVRVGGEMFGRMEE